MDRRKNPTDDIDSNASKVSDWVKKTFMTGVGAVFMTEEGIRNALSDMKLPKSVVSAAVSQADKTKKEISSLIAKEVRGFLDRIAVEDIIKKFLAGQSIEIHATIKFPDKKHDGKKRATKMAAEVNEDDD